jgi:hypothetical protein
MVIDPPAPAAPAAPKSPVAPAVTLPEAPPKPAPVPASVPGVVSEGQSRVLVRLLKMADTYRGTGSLRQAIEIYFELVNKYDETSEARMAEERLMEVGRTYERSGELRQARGIYERLL